jgi:hypothetical protein
MHLIPFLRIIVALAFLGVGSLAVAKSPALAYAGGDGSSFEKAVIIKTPPRKPG